MPRVTLFSSVLLTEAGTQNTDCVLRFFHVCFLDLAIAASERRMQDAIKNATILSLLDWHGVDMKDQSGKG